MFLRDTLLALCSSLLLYLSFPPAGFYGLAWVGLVPLLIALRGRKVHSALLLSAVAGYAFTYGHFQWLFGVETVNHLDYLLMTCAVGLNYVFFGLFFPITVNRGRVPALLAAPAVMVGADYLSGCIGFLSLPWAFLAHSQYVNLPMIQIARWTGAYGVTFLIVLVNVALCELVVSCVPALGRQGSREKKPRRLVIRHAAIALVLTAATGLYGTLVLAGRGEGRTLKVCLVQGNISPEENWDRSKHEEVFSRQSALTREALVPDTELLIWPEGAIPTMLSHSRKFMDWVDGMAREEGVHILLGSSRQAKFEDKKMKKEWGQAGMRRGVFNSAFLVSPGEGIVGQYNKIRLLPFGEYVPMKGTIDWPSWLVAKKVKSYLRGEEFTVFEMASSRFGVTICWENIFADLVRRFVEGGAEFMVNITNEVWFGEVGLPEQFLSMSVFRAVENGVSVVRAANSGISCIIDPHGEILGSVARDGQQVLVEGSLVGEVPLAEERTFYTLYGDVFAYGCLGLTFLALMLSCRPRRKEAARNPAVNGPPS